LQTQVESSIFVPNLFCGHFRSKFILRPSFQTKFILRPLGMHVILQPLGMPVILRFDFLDITVLDSIGKRYILRRPAFRSKFILRRQLECMLFCVGPIEIDNNPWESTQERTTIPLV
jgi:hypothetical protein